jgi:hypothetical protein
MDRAIELCDCELLAQWGYNKSIIVIWTMKFFYLFFFLFSVQGAFNGRLSAFIISVIYARL